MYPVEQVFTTEEQEIIFRIRTLIGDEKEVFVDDTSTKCDVPIIASGTMYQLEQPKGYPLEVYVNGIEYTTSGNPAILGYKYLKFPDPVLISGANLTIIYDHFRYSDLDILKTYDTSAMTYLTKQCSLTTEELGIDLLVLATAYVLLIKDMNDYIKSAIRLEDSDSTFDGTGRVDMLNNLLNNIANELLLSLKAKTSCKMISLPVYKVE